MSETSEKRTLAPHLIIIAVIVVAVLAIIFWPSSDEPIEVVEQAPAPVIEEPVAIEPETPDTFEPTPEPEAVEIDPNAEVEPMEPVIEPEPEPLDTSDGAVKAALMEIATSPTLARLLVNDGLIQRFVVNVVNLADEETAPNHQLLTPPSQSFRIYRQADREWIDAASYKRYTPYVEVLESMDNDQLMGLYEEYQSELQAVYDEIGSPGTPFNEVFAEAIDHLLDTPEIPMPVEVYTDSVMYKYSDDRLESLSSPQKQLLRTGPDNMRRIKAKLREVKSSLEGYGS